MRIILIYTLKIRIYKIYTLVVLSAILTMCQTIRQVAR